MNKPFYSIFLTFVSTFFVGTMASCSPITSTTPNLKEELDSNKNFDVCTILDFNPISNSKQIRHWNVKCIFSKNESKEFLTLHDPKVGEKLLIFDKTDEVLILPDYFLHSQETMEEIQFVYESQLGKFGGSLRVVAFEGTSSTEEFILVPGDWQLPSNDYSNVKYFLDNFRIVSECEEKKCKKSTLAFLIPLSSILTVHR